MPGLRGVGKTTILFQLYDYLVNEKNIDYKNILYLTMDQVKSYFNIGLLEYVDNFLDYTHKTSQIFLDKKIFIFVDECHFDKEWSLAGKILYDNSKNIFLIFTGSSALELEFNPDSARRSLKIPIFPNNFRDYLSLKHNININSKFGETLAEIIYFTDKKHVDKGINLEKDVYYDLFKLNNEPKFAFMEFLKEYGFATNLNSNKYIRYEVIMETINKIIEKDFSTIKSFTSLKMDVIRKIIYFIALSREGPLSNQKIANYLSISSRDVNEILNVLEKTQLIFPIKPYGNGGKIIKKPWKYYFLSPTLNAAINFNIGRFDLDSRQCLGRLAETLVASTLFKLAKTKFHFMDIFYPTEKKASDFIIKTKLYTIIPIEVGIGKKTKSQLSVTMNDYNADKGILISDRYSRIHFENDIIYIPLMSFGFI
jgi:predicted AAA+ superfamily ATPase